MKKLFVVLGCFFCLAACMTLPTSSEYLLRGDGYFKDGNYSKALNAYSRAIALNPGNLEAYSSRGSTHYFMGHYELAQADFEYILTKNPYQIEAYRAYGSVLASRGDYESALEVLEMAIRMQPNEPENFFSRAGVYFMLGRYPEAIVDYTTVLQSYPAADVYNARGAAYLYAGKKDLADKDFEAAKQPGLPATLSVYAAFK